MMTEEPIIQVSDLVYEYEEGQRALDGLSLNIQKGDFVAVVGHNGSGKSTFAKHINALFTPLTGKVLVLGMDSDEEDNVLRIRAEAGMVFQNPDNQMVTTIVEEDVAFGPENLGVPSAEIRQRVDAALQAVGMEAYARHAPHNLSGGQKQRIAIAGVLAMEPEIIILDESTAMLDPEGREDILQIAWQLNQEKGITIVLITHRMEELQHCDEVFVLNEGKIVIEGTPQEIFAQKEQLKGLGLDLPFSLQLADTLNQDGWGLPFAEDPELIADAIAEQWKQRHERSRS